MALYALDGVAPEPCPDGSNFIAPDAQLIGRVVLGRDASVWYGAVLRGDNEPIRVGERSNIQEHCVLHTDMGFPLGIGRDCTIGHRAMLHGCTIEDNCLVGIGAIILNGARIGRGSLVGAGALVTEGKIFPQNSLIIGSPARVARVLDADAVERIRLSAAHYVDNARRFRAGLREI
ncbi:MAG: gamma carbonic anhydrase family protein [Rhizobiaceae bacterium]